jgi:hypothetical protein
LAAVACMILAVGVIAVAAFQCVESNTGMRTMARVTDCQEIGHGKNRQDGSCEGTWQTSGGPVTGQINGVGRSDVGRRVAVRVHGGAAYSANWVEVIVLAALGVFLLLVPRLWGLKITRAAHISSGKHGSR